MTTTTRDAFEAEANLYDLDLNRFKEGYSDCDTDYGWLFWQAATEQGKRQPLTEDYLNKFFEAFAQKPETTRFSAFNWFIAGATIAEAHYGSTATPQGNI